MSLGKFKIALIVLIVCVISVSLNAEITRSDAEDLVLNQILADEIGSIDVYVSNEVINSPDVLQLWNDESISCPYTSNWVFFVDDMVFANWYHPCRYIFVNTDTGEYQIVDQNIYPENYENDFELIAEMPRPEPINLSTNPDATIESREPDYCNLLSKIYHNKSKYFNDNIDKLNLNLKLKDYIVKNKYQIGCGVGNRILYIHSDGNVKFCPTLPQILGNVYNESIKQIWERIDRKQREKLQCKNIEYCVYGLICGGGCRSRAYELTGKVDEPDIYECNLFEKIFGYKCIEKDLCNQD